MEVTSETDGIELWFYCSLILDLLELMSRVEIPEVMTKREEPVSITKCDLEAIFLTIGVQLMTAEHHTIIVHCNQELILEIFKKVN